jgi:hypothetical protein
MAYYKSVCCVDYFFSYLYRFSCLRETDLRKQTNNVLIYAYIYWLMFTVVLKEKTHKEKLNILSNYFCFSSPYAPIYQYYTYSYEGLNKMKKVNFYSNYLYNICNRFYLLVQVNEVKIKTNKQRLL